MSRYVIEMVPEWCDGVLKIDFDGRSEEAVLARVDELLKEGVSGFDITAVDVWEEEEDDDERHIVCFSYPNCDEAPMGCVVRMGGNAEPYGHRD